MYRFQWMFLNSRLLCVIKSENSIFLFANFLSKLGFLSTVTLSTLVNLLLSNSLSLSLNTDDKSRLFLLLSCELSTYYLVGNSIVVFGDVKVELRITESCSSGFSFSS